MLDPSLRRKASSGSASGTRLLYGVTPHAETGEPPGFVISHPLLGDLFDEIGRMLAEYLRPDSTTTPQAALDRVVARMAELRLRTR